VVNKLSYQSKPRLQSWQYQHITCVLLSFTRHWAQPAQLGDVILFLCKSISFKNSQRVPMDPKSSFSHEVASLLTNCLVRTVSPTCHDGRWWRSGQRRGLRRRRSRRGSAAIHDVAIAIRRRYTRQISHFWVIVSHKCLVRTVPAGNDTFTTSFSLASKVTWNAPRHDHYVTGQHISHEFDP
jgi:hypothetical protein